MGKGKAKDFYQLEIYGRYESISNMLWSVVEKWSRRHQYLIGDQLLRAVDSVGANIAESVGRGHFWESLHHLFYGRGSLAETQHWIRRAVHLRLLPHEQIDFLRAETTTLYKQLNAYIRAQRKSLSSVERLKANDRVEEDASPYGRLSEVDAQRWRIGNAGRSLDDRRSSSQQPVASSNYPDRTHRIKTRKPCRRGKGA